MPKQTRNPKAVIPEPSPRFIFWSGVAATLALIAILALDYANGWIR
jgi:hypothetical protein